MSKVTFTNSAGQKLAAGIEIDPLTGKGTFTNPSAQDFTDAEAIVANCRVQVELAQGPRQQPGALYPLYLDAEQLQRVKALLEQASSREADPDSPIFHILDEVRAARRRNPLLSLSPDTATSWTPRSS